MDELIETARAISKYLRQGFTLTQGHVLHLRLLDAIAKQKSGQ